MSLPTTSRVTAGVLAMTLRKAHTRGRPSPLVEAVTKHPGDWVVKNDSFLGRTDNVRHRMLVPLNDDLCQCGTSHNDYTRAHELLHSKISPERAEPVEVEYQGEMVEVSAKNITTAEEYRVNYSLRIIEGLTLLRSGFCEDLTPKGVASMMDRGEHEDIIRLAMAGGPTYDRLIARSLLTYSRDLKTLLKGKSRAERRAMGKPIKDRIKIAKALAHSVSRYNAVAIQIMGTDIDTYWKELPAWTQVEELAAFLEVNLREFSDQLEDLTAEGEEDLEPLMPSDKYSLDPTLSMPGDGNGDGDGCDCEDCEGTGDGDRPVVWGEPDEITTAPLTKSIPAWKLQKHNRAVDEGTIPRYMHRWPIDQRVFQRTKRLPGGSILIDASGSMCLEPKDLDAMIEAAPAATIAIYAGIDGGNGGEIRIVAQDGKRATADDLVMGFGGNGIDGPALEWLGEQSSPRVWISDGVVTSVSHGMGARVLNKAAADLCRRHDITLTGTAEKAAEMLKRGTYAR